MARKRKGPSISGYFRELFGKEPGLLNSKSNAAILERYRKEKGLAPDAELEKRVLNNLANVKSILRRRGRKRGGNSSVKVESRGTNRLESLEELIDECLTLAKNLDREQLAGVITLLRRARNEVVWKLGQ